MSEKRSREKASLDVDKAARRKKSKKKKKKKRGKQPEGVVDHVVPVEAPLLPDFPDVLVDDHCETPAVAYEHLESFLVALMRALGKTSRSELCIYDPYYCAGAVVQHLSALGFSNVINARENCYEHWQDREYDVLVTNPPYSGDHMERLCQFLEHKKKPFALLVPNFVHKKPYYRQVLEKWRPFYVVARKRYVYVPPAGFREKKASDTQKKTSPFVTFWHLWAGHQHNLRVQNEVYKTLRSGELDLCRSKNALRDLRRKK